MRSPSKAMLRSPARAGHGSTMWVTLLVATASPAAKLTVSRRSRYMSVHPVSAVAAASASNAPRKLLRDIDDLSLGDVEDVTDRGRAPVCPAANAAIHRHGYFRLTEQEDLGTVRRPRAIERRAQRVARAGRAHQARRHDDHEIGFFLLISGATHQRAEHRHVGQPRQLLLVRATRRLQKTGDREALAVAQLHRGVGAPHDQRRDTDRANADAGGGIDLTHLRLDLQIDHAVALPSARRG